MESFGGDIVGMSISYRDADGYDAREICETLGNEARVTGEFSELRNELDAAVRYVEYLRRKVEYLAQDHDLRARRWARVAFLEHGVTIEELQDRTGWDSVQVEAAIGAPLEQGRIDRRIPDTP